MIMEDDAKLRIIMKKTVLLILCAAILLSFTGCGQNGYSVSEPAVEISGDTPGGETAAVYEDIQEGWIPESYEVHLMLDSDAVLNEENLLRQEFLEMFGADEKCKVFSLAYFETMEQDFFAEGWINRLRLKYEENRDNNYKLSYKKRYSVTGNDLGSAVRLAEAEGFDLTGGKWDPQVDWGYSGMTLSLSLDVTIPAGATETVADPEPEKALSMIRDNMPAVERNWMADSLGSDAMDSAVMAGPIYFIRYKGDYHGREVSIEIWQIRDPGSDNVYYLSELSFKADDYDQASASRKQMMEDLLKQGILLKVDSLKTQQMLDAYLIAPD